MFVTLFSQNAKGKTKFPFSNFCEENWKHHWCFQLFFLCGTWILSRWYVFAFALSEKTLLS